MHHLSTSFIRRIGKVILESGLIYSVSLVLSIVMCVGNAPYRKIFVDAVSNRIQLFAVHATQTISLGWVYHPHHLLLDYPSSQKKSELGNRESGIHWISSPYVDFAFQGCQYWGYSKSRRRWFVNRVCIRSSEPPIHRG